MTLQKIWYWILYSSQDPSKISLTVKGALMLAIPYAMTFLSLDQGILTGLAENIALLIQSVLTFVGTAVFIWGALRKLVNTFRAV